MCVLTKLIAFTLVLLFIGSIGAVTVSAQSSDSVAGTVSSQALIQINSMQFHYNAAHTGDYSAVAGPVPPTGKLKWSYPTKCSVDSSPAVANGLVYVTGSNDSTGYGMVYAINATSGKLKWSFTNKGSIYTSPAVANGLVCVGSNDHKVYALNAISGKLVWSFTTRAIVLADPTVANGVVYVASYDHVFYALNAATGKQKWNFTAGGSMWKAPAVANGVVYLGARDKQSLLDKVYAFNATNGKQKWNFTPPSGTTISPPAVANGMVYISNYNNDIYAINAATGKMVWSHNIEGSIDASYPAVANGVVYVGSDYPDGKVYALNANNGIERWNFTLGAWDSAWKSSPAVANGVVYIGGWYLDKTSSSAKTVGVFYALNAITGKPNWNYTTGGAVWSSPAIANGMVYFGSVDSKLNNMVYAIGSHKPTSLTIAAPASASKGVNFTISGRLTSGSTGLASQTIKLQVSFDNKTWSNSSTTAKTDATGWYRLTQRVPFTLTVYYRSVYTGSATYAVALSKVVKVVVT